MSDMFLNKEDVAILTGAKIKSKQIAQLRKMGLVFWVNALGVPVVPRSAIDGRSAKVPVEKSEWVPPGCGVTVMENDDATLHIGRRRGHERRGEGEKCELTLCAG